MTGAWRWGVIRGCEARPASPILKIGGSLLMRPDWPEALNNLLGHLDRPLIVVGGGTLVEGLRAIDAVNPRPPRLMHDLAIDAMALTARLVAEAVELPVVPSPNAAMAAVLDVAGWLSTAKNPAAIPFGWEVTSDSLAAVVARVDARPLVLAKSVPPPPQVVSMHALAHAGWVDAWFPEAIGPTSAVWWAAPRASS